MKQRTNRVGCGFVFVISLLMMLVFSSYAFADVPITIIQNTKWDAASLNENKINKIIKKNFDLDDTILSKVKVKVLYKDSGKLSHLVVYLLNNIDYTFETARVNLGNKYKVISVKMDYQETQSELKYNQEYECYGTCPDPSVEMVFSTCCTEFPSSVAAINEAYNIATANGYNAVKLIGSQENTQAIKNWYACPNLIMHGRVGHGNTSGILLDDGTISYSYFNGLPSDELKGKVLYYNSCQVHNSPLEPAIMSAGTQAYVGGDVNLWVGSSEEVFKCWMNKVVSQGKEFCPSVPQCEDETGYQSGDHGYSQDYSQPTTLDGSGGGGGGGGGDYCTSSGGSSNYEWISGVHIGSMSNTSSASGYSDFTNKTLSVSANETVTVSLTPGFSGGSYTESWKVWIDYNQDGDFEDSGEAVFSKSGSSTVSGSFTVPGSASGATRMRVSMSYGSAPPYCGTFTYGEVEDYTVDIDGGVQTYTLSVISGTGDGDYTPGAQVTITANSAPSGQVFDHWVVNSGSPQISNVNASSTTLTMPYGDVKVTATYKDDGGGGGGGDYCTSSGSSYNYEWIAGVHVGTLNNTSSASGYTDFTNKTLSVSANDSVSVSLTPGFSGGTYTESWKVWIDYNLDGDFEDSGEAVFSKSGSSTVSGSFTVPTSATGTTRMRVSMSYGSAPPYCGTFSYGEVEDYAINISGGSQAYTLTVASGSGDGNYEAGQSVTITANSAPSGQVFDKWVVNSGSPQISNVNASSTTLTMPSGDVKVTATYKDDGGGGGGGDYCTSSGSSCNYEWIAGVHIGTLNNTSSASGYTDFTNKTLSVSANDSVSVSLTPGFSGGTYTEYWKVWIDYNLDGDFEDSGEAVFSKSGSSSVSGSFTVPSSASGATRMRVSMSYGSAPPCCGTFSYGEVEDYTINIGGGAQNYKLSVSNGSGDGNYEAGKSVSITANTPPSGQVFDQWAINSGSPQIANVNASSTTLTMPAGNVTISATYTDGGGGGDYCTSSGNTNNYEWIAGVHIGTLNNTSGASGYTDFTNKTLSVSTNESISVSLTPGFSGGSYTENWRIWIDYNRDGDFEDSGEEVYSNSGSSSVSGSFTVPSSATGITNMRVSMSYGSAPPCCGTFSYGEVEDYTVIVGY